MKNKMFCKYHPEKKTGRRCYYCKEPICSECQLHLDNHLFCSKKCYYRWKADNLVRRLKPYKQLLLFIALIIISDFIILLFLNNKPQPNNTAGKRKSAADSATSSFPIHAEEKVSGSEMVFRVDAPQNSLIALAKDGKFVKTFIIDKSRQAMINVPLHSGKNKFNLYLIKTNSAPKLLDSISVSYFSKRNEFLARPVYQVNTKKKLIALTFDGGSLDRGTLNILDTLRNYKVHTTIFLTGAFIRHFPNLVKRMVDDGYEIGNHSYSHPHLTQLEINGSSKTLNNVDYDFLCRQLERADSAFYSVSGKHFAPLWRAPYGEFNKEIIDWAAACGYKHVGWSAKCDTWDWVADSASSIYRTKIEILARLLLVEEKYGLNGKIILMHLGTERRSELPYEILGRIIRELRKRNYRFVTITELINSK